MQNGNMAYQIDSYLGSLRSMQKITDSHVNPEKIQKMKVAKYTQVFSHSVAAAINVFAISGMIVHFLYLYFSCCLNIIKSVNLHFM